MQHGQRITDEPRELLRKAGFTRGRRFRKGTSAAARPGPTTSCSRNSPASCATRKVANINSVQADIVAAGNIGCITQLGRGTETPIVHTVELLDWAYGGPVPRGLERFASLVKDVPGPQVKPRGLDAYIGAAS